MNKFIEEEKDSDKILKMINENTSDKLGLEDEEKKHNNKILDLINACKYEDEKEIKRLIKNGADVNMKNEYGDTSLTILCEKMNLDSLKLIEVLIKNGAKINVNNSTGSSALNILCKKCDENSLSLIDCLIKNGADINYKDENGITPLLMTCYFNNISTFSHLIKMERTDINIKNNYEDSPLMISSYFNNKRIIKGLINKNANIYLKNIDGDTYQTIITKLKKKRNIISEKIKNGNLYIYL